MPAKSKAQKRFMEAIAHGWKPSKGGPSKEQAKEFVSGNKGKKAYSKLPEKISKEVFKPIGSDIKAVHREDRALPKQPNPKPAKPKTKITMDWIKEQKKKLAPGAFKRSDEDEWDLERLNKAFERRDDYTLVDPREFYGALEHINSQVMGWVKEATKDMKDGDTRDYPLPFEDKKVVLKVRKLMNDMYSGYLIDKSGDINHLFDRVSLPVLATQIMSAYEVYPDKIEGVADDIGALAEKELEESKENPSEKDEEKLESDILHSMKQQLLEINTKLKSGKLDKETKSQMLILVDKLSSVARVIKELQEHEEAEEPVEVEEVDALKRIRRKLEALKNQVPEVVQEPAVLSSGPVVVAPMPESPPKCHDCGMASCVCYNHLSKPMIEIMPSGKISIFFKSDWQNQDKVTYLKGMKYAILEKHNKS